VPTAEHTFFAHLPRLREVHQEFTDALCTEFLRGDISELRSKFGPSAPAQDLLLLALTDDRIRKCNLSVSSVFIKGNRFRVVSNGPGDSYDLGTRIREAIKTWSSVQENTVEGSLAKERRISLLASSLHSEKISRFAKQAEIEGFRITARDEKITAELASSLLSGETPKPRANMTMLFTDASAVFLHGDGTISAEVPYASEFAQKVANLESRLVGAHAPVYKRVNEMIEIALIKAMTKLPAHLLSPVDLEIRAIKEAFDVQIFIRDLASAGTPNPPWTLRELGAVKELLEKCRWTLTTEVARISKTPSTHRADTSTAVSALAHWWADSVVSSLQVDTCPGVYLRPAPVERDAPGTEGLWFAFQPAYLRAMMDFPQKALPLALASFACNIFEKEPNWYQVTHSSFNLLKTTRLKQLNLQSRIVIPFFPRTQG